MLVLLFLIRELRFDCLAAGECAVEGIEGMETMFLRGCFVLLYVRRGVCRLRRGELEEGHESREERGEKEGKTQAGMFI